MTVPAVRTVLVTGAGVLGRAVAGRLGVAGRRCMVLDRSAVAMAGLPGRLGDVTNAADVGAAMAQVAPDAVVHTAAVLSAGAATSPVQAVAANVLGTAVVLDAARRAGVRRVVLAGSSSVQYSAVRHLAAPVPEDFDLRTVTEAPASLYAATKLSAEWIARCLGQDGTPEVVVLRFAPLLHRPGPGGVVERLLAALAQPLDGPVVIDDPRLVWAGVEEFLDARDAADAVLAALDASHPGQVYNVAPGQAVTTAQFMAAAEASRPGLRVERWPDVRTGLAGFAHPRLAASDISAVQRDLRWSPRRGLGETLAHALASTEAEQSIASPRQQET